jgi:hypothetical protein
MGATEMDASRTMRDLLHDLRNSLSVILAHAHLLVNRPYIGSGMEALRVICQESTRMAGMLSLIPDNLGGVTLGGDDVEDPAGAAQPR